MHTGQAIADELLGDERESVAVAGTDLLRRKARALANLEEHIARAVGDPAVELALLIAVVGAGGRVRRVLGNAGKLERFAVVIGRVTAAMTHRHRMLARDPVEVVDGERALVL